MSENPFQRTTARPHREGEFAYEEMALANRNHGMALEALRYDVTPAGMHYLLTHFDIPALDATSLRLDISGEVGKPQSVSLAEIKAMPAVTHRVTLECAGNGRGHMAPRNASMPWLCEAVGTAEWTGTPLRPLLDRAGLTGNAVDVVFFGADRGFDKGIEHDYGRALKPSEALAKDIILCYAMNGAPLLPQHGYPLRLIVPGWYGMTSVKWLTRIEVWDKPFDGPQQTPGYHYRTHADELGTPVTTMRVKSLMLPPGMPDWYTRHRLVEQGNVRLQGRAWSGAGVPVSKVEVAVNGEWRAAKLAAADGRYAWRGWHIDWQASPGEYELCCRATDANGEMQPVNSFVNRLGMGNNEVQRIKVWVR